MHVLLEFDQCPSQDKTVEISSILFSKVLQEFRVKPYVTYLFTLHSLTHFKLSLTIPKSQHIFIDFI